MKNLTGILFMSLSLGIISCSKYKDKTLLTEEAIPMVYENDLFSVEIPKGWICDSSGWHGLDAQKNEVDIYDPKGNFVRFHFVKTFMPFKWKDIDEAKEFAKTAKSISGDEAELINEIDSIEIGGYPACILCFANYIDNDTLIQKQFITYQQDSHIVSYFNEVFPIQFWDEAQEIGDYVISTIRLKKVTNPLEDGKAVEKALEEGMKNHVIDEKYVERGRKLIEQMEQKDKYNESEIIN